MTMETLRKHDPQGIVPSHCVHLANEQTRVGMPRHEDVKEPKIVLIRNGDNVEAIEVACTCGQRIRLKCVF
jgi:hypothetical protein